MRHASLLFTGLLAATLALPALAEDAHHPDQAKPSAAAPAKAPEQSVKKMQSNVKLMQAQLNRLGKAKDEAEFQKILAEHRQTMQENMMLAAGMAGMAGGGCPMMPGMQGMGGMQGMQGMQGGQGMPCMMGGAGGMGSMHEAMMQRMEQVEKRLDALEQAAKPAPGR